MTTRNPRWIVLKFGGTSVSNLPNWNNIAAVARKNDPILAGRTKARWKEVHRALRARAKVDPKLKR